MISGNLDAESLNKRQKRGVTPTTTTDATGGREGPWGASARGGGGKNEDEDAALKIGSKRQADEREKPEHKRASHHV